MTDSATILRLLDNERQKVAETGVRLEKAPYVVRAFGEQGSGCGILYSRFSPSQSAGIVEAEIAYFSRLNREFEWKVYSHDRPLDLLTQLRNRGFRIGEEESLMIRELEELPEALRAPLPEAITVRPVLDDPGIADFLEVEAAVWTCEPNKTRELLRSTLGHSSQRELAFVAYSEGRPIGGGRVTASPHSQFAGLWGGSVLPEYRSRGVYRALLSARIDHIRQFEAVRYLRVDALPTSRPILEKYGFERVASTWPAEWPPASTGLAKGATS